MPSETSSSIRGLKFSIGNSWTSSEWIILKNQNLCQLALRYVNYSFEKMWNLNYLSVPSPFLAVLKPSFKNGIVKHKRKPENLRFRVFKDLSRLNEKGFVMIEWSQLWLALNLLFKGINRIKDSSMSRNSLTQFVKTIQAPLIEKVLTASRTSRKKLTSAPKRSTTTATQFLNPNTEWSAQMRNCFSNPGHGCKCNVETWQRNENT